MAYSCRPFVKISFFSLLTGVLLAGCKVGPDFKPETAPNTNRYTHLPMPKQTVSTGLNKNAGKSQRFIAGRDLQGDWWTIFHSKAINQLVATGIANNQDLQAAKASLREATYTLYSEEGALLYPSIDFNGFADRMATNPITVGVTNTGSSVFNVYNATFQASYVLDVWGASRREVESYAAQVDYQRYEMLGTYLSLTTNIVTTAITIASLDAQIKATCALIRDEEKILRITKEQFAVGGVSDQNVLSAQTTLFQSESTLPPLLKTLSDEQHALAVLIGKPTSQFMDQIISLQSLQLPKNVPVSLPSTLIRQRPDIQASEALLHAASANIGVATANLLPEISITGNFGYLSPTLANFFSYQNQAWGFGTTVLQHVFHGGQYWMARKASTEAFKQARAQYKQTVLQAFKNVSDALRAIQYDADYFKQEIQAEKSALGTYRLTKKQYLVGGQNYLSVLQTQAQYEQTVLARIKAQAMRYSDTAGLYQALGGGWWNYSIKDYNLKNSQQAEKKTV